MSEPGFVLRRWFDAHAADERDVARSLMSPSAEIHVGQETLSGFDALMSWYDNRRASLPDFRYEVLDLLGGDSHAAAVIRLSDRDRSWRQVAVYEIRHGEIVSMTLYEDEPHHAP